MIGAFSYNKRFRFFGQLKNTAYSIDTYRAQITIINHVGNPHRYLYLKLKYSEIYFKNLKYL